MSGSTHPIPSSTSRDVGGLGGPIAGVLLVTAIAGAGRLARDAFPRRGIPRTHDSSEAPYA